MNVWIGTSGGGYEVKASGTLKGLSEMIGASYSTMKSKSGDDGGGPFVVVVKDESGGIGKSWFCVRVEVSKIEGRGGWENRAVKDF